MASKRRSRTDVGAAHTAPCYWRASVKMSPRGAGQLSVRTCAAMLFRESGLLQLRYSDPNRPGAHRSRKFHYFYSKFYSSARNKLELGEI